MLIAQGNQASRQACRLQCLAVHCSELCAPVCNFIAVPQHAVQWAGRNPGKRHLVMAETIKHADPDQRIIRMNILGRDVVFSNNPAVHHALLRQGGWLPKNMVFYRALTMLVRAGQCVFVVLMAGTKPCTGESRLCPYLLPRKHVLRAVVRILALRCITVQP